MTPGMLDAGLRCTVRGCGHELLATPDGRRLLCAGTHSFDRARAGYWNLLQPQDRRSPRPGDPAAAAHARRRLFLRGHDTALVARIAGLLAQHRKTAAGRWLDIGCGEGSILNRLLGVEASVLGVGVDLSIDALTLAARSYPNIAWVVANADRGLPMLDASCDVVLSLASRLPVLEMARVLEPAAGVAVVAVPGPDDLRELRERVQGEAKSEDRAAVATQTLAAHFDLVARSESRAVLSCGRDDLEDLLDASYRGGRRGRREALAAIDRLDVTIARDILLLRPR